MGYEYINIDSRHRNIHEGNSEIKVHLSSPIHHAKSVRLIAFSAPNEFFNVIKDNNTITLVSYDLNAGVSTAVSVPYTIDPGLYSVDELITALNVKFSAVPVGASTAIATKLTNNKVQIQINHATNADKRVVIYYPKSKEDKNDPFEKSIIHRLGFHRLQISDSIADNLIVKIASNVFINYNNGRSIIQSTEADWIADEKRFLIWNSSSVNTALKTFTGTHIGYESYCGHLFVKSDLVKDFHSTVRDSANDIVFTTQRNILQKIDVNVNIHSYIHYRGDLAEAIVHSLSGQPISHFTIQLTDDAHNLFTDFAFKHFSCVLMFETHDNLASTRLNEKVIENNQRSIFLANHNC
jgi:hypothetical protein